MMTISTPSRPIPYESRSMTSSMSSFPNIHYHFALFSQPQSSCRAHSTVRCSTFESRNERAR